MKCPDRLHDVFMFVIDQLYHYAHRNLFYYDLCKLVSRIQLWSCLVAEGGVLSRILELSSKSRMSRQCLACLAVTYHVSTWRGESDSLNFYLARWVIKSSINLSNSNIIYPCVFFFIPIYGHKEIRFYISHDFTIIRQTLTKVHNFFYRNWLWKMVRINILWKFMNNSGYNRSITTIFDEKPWNFMKIHQGGNWQN